MKVSKPRAVRWICCIALLALAASTAVAEEKILSGADLWPTAKGTSFTSFADDPIPADFFCPGSQPFSGTVFMNGEPIVTDPPGVLGSTDTIVHRLDDATFDDSGIATTRLQMMALSMVGTEPIEVGCETPFDVAASLDGEQPLTEMRIYRDAEWGGRYASPLSLHVKVVFTPIGDGEARQVNREIYLGPAPGSYWTTTDRVGTDAWGDPVQVDTDGDGAPDSSLPGPSNFVAGGEVLPAAATTRWCRGVCCHCKPEDSFPEPNWEEDGSNCDPDHLHCVPCWRPPPCLSTAPSEVEL